MARQPQSLDPLGEVAVADVVGAQVGELLHGAHEEQAVLQHMGVLGHEVVGDVVVHEGVAVELQHLVVGGLGVDLQVGFAGQDLDEQALVVEGVADGRLDLADGFGTVDGQHGGFPPYVRQRDACRYFVIMGTSRSASPQRSGREPIWHPP